MIFPFINKLSHYRQPICIVDTSDRSFDTRVVESFPRRVERYPARVSHRLYCRATVKQRSIDYTPTVIIYRGNSPSGATAGSKPAIRYVRLDLSALMILNSRPLDFENHRSLSETTWSFLCNSTQRKVQFRVCRASPTKERVPFSFEGTVSRKYSILVSWIFRSIERTSFQWKRSVVGRRARKNQVKIYSTSSSRCSEKTIGIETKI